MLLKIRIINEDGSVISGIAGGEKPKISYFERYELALGTMNSFTKYF